MSRQPTAYPGSTLIELIVAMTVGAIVMLGTRQLFEQLSRSARSVAQYTAITSGQSNAEQLVRELVRRAEVGLELPPFEGTTREMHFGSWCDAVGGWTERCLVHLSPNAEATEWTFAEDTPEDSPHALRVKLGGVQRFIYYDASNEPRTWKVSWPRGNPLPLAVALVRASDTLILRIGYRG